MNRHKKFSRIGYIIDDVKNIKKPLKGYKNIAIHQSDSPRDRGDSANNINLKMPQVFGNEMVLQRDMPISVWGLGKPGGNIIVSFKDNVVKTVVDKDGKWMVALPKLKGDFKTSDLRISCSSGDELVFHDVLVGEVWICPGQSNMEMNLKYAYNSYTEVKNATLPSRITI